MDWVSRRAQLRHAWEHWLLAAQREWQSMRVGARRALACFLAASAWIGTWFLAVWSLGALVVYDDVYASEGANVTSPGDGDTQVVVAANQPASLRTAGQGSGPMVPRVSKVYAFDEWPREVRGAVACPEVALSEYAGSRVQFVPAARVAAPFREHVAELERVVREVSEQFYGRAPSALQVAASYDCRPVTGNRRRLSEHALGNAIDIAAFRFDAAGSEPAFEVRVDRHWKASGGDRNARFLRAVTQALIARDVFRTLLGPAHPDHHDHFHFDMAPHHYVHL
jgi:extensin-like protein